MVNIDVQIINAYWFNGYYYLIIFIDSERFDLKLRDKDMELYLKDSA